MMPLSMIGQRFCRLTVIEPAPQKKPGNTYWQCRCDCGKEIVVTRNSLRSANTRSCGCLQREKASGQIIDLSGKTFGELMVIGKDGRDKFGVIKWLCKCSCGTEKSISGASLRSGNTRSCGCLQLQIARSKTIPDGGSVINKLYGQYKNKSIKKGRDFCLSKDKFIELIKKRCEYCGAEPSNVFRSKQSKFVYNGIDRINNLEGYTEQNTVACCSICNYAKRDMDRDVFINWARNLCDYQNRKISIKTP